jgi:hypothetical protein
VPRPAAAARLRALATVVAVSGALLTAGFTSAHAATGTTALVVDTLNPNALRSQLVFDTSLSGQQIALTQSGSTITLTGSKTGSSSTATVAIAPPTDGAFAVGTTYPTAYSASAGTPSLRVPCGTGSGTLRVDDLTTSGGVVQTLAATWTSTCSGSATSSGELRYQSAVPYEALQAPSPRFVPDAAIGVDRSVTLTLTSNGSMAVTLGPITTSVVGNATGSLSDDTCSSTVLAPGTSCTVAVHVTNNAKGVAWVTLSVPDDTAAATHTIRVTGTGVAAPLTPYQALAVGYDGVAVTGNYATDPNGAPPVTGLRVYRDNGDGTTTLLQEVPKASPASSFTRWVDTSIAPGATGSYRISAYGPGGESPPSDVMTSPVVPVQTIPVPGTTNVLTAEPLVAAGSGMPSSLVSPTVSVWDNGPGYLTLRGQGDSLDTFLTLRWGNGGLLPGDYTTTVASDRPADSVYLNVWMGNSSLCNSGGTLHLTDAVFHADGTPEEITGTYTQNCDSAVEVAGEIRWKSSTSYRAAHVTPVTTDAGAVRLGTASTVKSVTVANAGTQDLTLSTSSTTGPWAVLPTGTCASGLVLHVGDSCRADVQVTPTAQGDANGLLDIGADTARGHLMACLLAKGVTLPSVPQAVTASLVVGHGLVTWSPPATDGGSTVTSYVVRKSVNGAAFTALATVAGTVTSAPVATLTTGSTYTFDVQAVTAVGGSDRAKTSGTAAPRREVIVGAAGLTDPGFGISALPDGGGARVPLVGNSVYADTPAVSRDGAQVVYSNGGSLYEVARTGGAVAKLTSGTNDTEPSFSPDRSRIVFTRNNALSTMPVVAGQVTSNVPNSTHLARPSFLPDGKTIIAWDTTTGNVVRLPAGGTPTPIVAGQQPMVSRDGTKLTFIRVTAVDSNMEPTASQIWTSSITGASPTLLSPAAGGPNFYPTWSPNADAVYFEHDGSSAPSILKAPVTGAGLTVVPGVAGDWLIAPTVYDADVTAPKASLVTPTARLAGPGTITVKAMATDSETGVASYDFRYRQARYDRGFGAAVYPAGWQKLSASSLGFSLARGYDQCFSTRARDRAGNVSAWSAEKCITVPLDDRALGAGSGWSRLSAAGNYASTLSKATSAGRTLQLPAVQVVRGWLLATRCSTCGSVTVIVGGHVLGVIDLHAATTQRQVRIPLPGAGALRTGALVLKTRSSQQVLIDGLAIARS